ncbi:MAG TPA: hypothetical protein DD727_08985 [Clostridiales bacterium]|nr:hypothetical protein [Clostridiales bacterium]
MAKQPNLVFLLNDHQLHYRHGWEEGPRIQRMYFDRLAAEGVRFDRAYSVCPLCGPARRSMLTGLYPHHHGEIHNDINHPFDRDTYLDLLATAGYRNFYFGKWHAGPGNAHDHHCEGFSYPSYNNPYTKPEYREYLERHHLPEPEILVEKNFLWKKDTEGCIIRQDMGWCNEHASGLMLTPRETHESFFLASLACDQLRELSRQRSDSNENRPFSLRVDFWGPHQPYFPTMEYARLYDPKEIPVYGNFNDTLKDKPDTYHEEGNAGISMNGRLIQPNPIPWKEWQKVLARCYAQITQVDAAGGMILNCLAELGLDDNTLVVWSADHGDALACHGGHFDKRAYMPEEMLRIPMAIRFPGKIPPGQCSDQLVSNMDIPVTLLDASGLNFPGGCDGRSLLEVASGTGSGPVGQDDLMCESYGHGQKVFARILLTERYKYIHTRNYMDELYDLQKDPYELNNLAVRQDCREILMDMQRRLKKKQAEVGDDPGFIIASLY